MQIPEQLAKQLRGVYFGGNWTVSCLKEHLADVTWEEALQRPYGFNSIAILTYHIHYFVQAQLSVLEGGPLDAKDEWSFDHPQMTSAADWQSFLETVWTEGERLAKWIEELPEERLEEDFTDPKYGSWYRNLAGNVEHAHYHLGQITLIKKIVINKKIS